MVIKTSDTTLIIQDSDSGKLTLENISTCTRQDNPVLIPVIAEPTVTNRTDCPWVDKIFLHEGKEASWAHDFSYKKKSKGIRKRYQAKNLLTKTNWYLKDQTNKIKK